MISLTSTLVSAADTGSCAADRDLELRRAELRMNLLDADPGRLQAVGHVADVVRRLQEPGQPVAGAADRGLEVSLVPADHPFHFERHQGADPLAQAGGQLGPGERALASGVDGAVLVEPVAGCPGPAIRRRQHGQPIQVRDHPEVAFRGGQRGRPVDAARGRERIENRREPQPGPGGPGQAGQRHRLDPCCAAMVDEGRRDPADLARELPLEDLRPALVRGALLLAAELAERPWHRSASLRLNDGWSGRGPS